MTQAPTTVVTGATGHIGVNLVRELVRRGRHVRAVIHCNSGGLDGVDIERVVADVLDRDSLRTALGGADIVYHLAARISISGDRGGDVSRVNVEGTRNVATIARANGVRRMVHCCSIHAFEQLPVEQPLDETRPRVAGGDHPAYDCSKAEGESVVRRLVDEGLDAVIVHPTAVIGPLDFKPSRVGRVFLDLFHRRLPALLDGGFNWVDVRDVVAGLIAAEEGGRTNESYILGGHWHSVGDLAAMAARATQVAPPRLTAPMWLARLGVPFVEIYGKLAGVEPLYTRESLAALRSNRHVSSDKAKRELGYCARPTAETVDDTYAFFEAGGFL